MERRLCLVSDIKDDEAMYSPQERLSYVLAYYFTAHLLIAVLGHRNMSYSNLYVMHGTYISTYDFTSAF